MSLHNLNFNVTIDYNCSQSGFPEEATLRRHLIATPLRDLYWILNSFGFLRVIYFRDCFFVCQHERKSHHLYFNVCCYSYLKRKCTSVVPASCQILAE